MVQYEVTVNLTPKLRELFNVDAKQFMLEFPGPVGTSQIEKAVLDKIPDACVLNYQYKEVITVLPGDIVWIKFYGDYGSFSFMKEVTSVDTAKGTFTVPLTEDDLQLIYSNLDYKTYKSYCGKNHLVFSMGDCIEICKKKNNKATVRLANVDEIEAYHDSLKREEIVQKINTILADYFDGGCCYNKTFHTTEDLEKLLSALKIFVKKAGYN